MKKIPLGRSGTFALVNDEDYPMLSKFKWHKAGKEHHYAVTSANGKRTLMHRMLIETELPCIDHKDGNGLNNQRENLRPCTTAENGRNRRPNRNSTSKYKGVSKAIIKGYHYWAAYITLANSNSQILGYFKTEEDAALAYNEAASKMFGDFAFLNTLRNRNRAE